MAFAHNKQSLWVQLLKRKYNIAGDFWSYNIVSGLGVCKSLKQDTALLRDGLAWRIRSRRSVNFWIDRWCGMSPFVDLCPNNFNIQWDLKVADVLKNGAWDVDLLNSLLPLHLV